MKSAISWLLLLKAVFLILSAACAADKADLDIMGAQPESLSIFGDAEDGPLDLNLMAPAPERMVPRPADDRLDRILDLLEKQEARIDALERPQQAPAIKADLPVMFCYLAPPDVPCVYCEAAKATMTKPGTVLPFRPEFKYVAIKEAAYPLFVWLDHAGKPKKLAGWHGLDALLMEWHSSMVPMQQGPAKQISRPAASSWEAISRSRGPHWYEGDGRFPTTREHLWREHGIPLEETRGMSQGQLDRIHGYKHTGASNDRIRRRAIQLCAAEMRSKKA